VTGEGVKDLEAAMAERVLIDEPISEPEVPTTPLHEEQ
jgi:hypothetical protein